MAAHKVFHVLRHRHVIVSRVVRGVAMIAEILMRDKCSVPLKFESIIRETDECIYRSVQVSGNDPIK